jgi:hypothetical protein
MVFFEPSSTSREEKKEINVRRQLTAWQRTRKKGRDRERERKETSARRGQVHQFSYNKDVLLLTIVPLLCVTTFNDGTDDLVVGVSQIRGHSIQIFLFSFHYRQCSIAIGKNTLDERRSQIVLHV